MDWQGLTLHKVDLKYPLLVIQGSKGILACAYINPQTCTNKTDEACAIVTGVKSFDDMVSAKVIALSEQAKALGIEEGMTGGEALKILK